MAVGGDGWGKSQIFNLQFSIFNAFYNDSQGRISGGASQLETFTALKDLVDDPHYHEQRQKALNSLDLKTIDAPILEIVSGFSKLPYCFTLQSCYGHFLYQQQRDPQNIAPLPKDGNITTVEYRIAYIALCLENNELGKKLFRDLGKTPIIDQEYIQFGCAEWFWKKQLNTYALQVEPTRYMNKDKAFVSYQEALRIEKIRDRFFHALTNIVQKRVP
jgi:hypothetical protein